MSKDYINSNKARIIQKTFRELHWTIDFEEDEVQNIKRHITSNVNTFKLIRSDLEIRDNSSVTASVRNDLDPILHQIDNNSRTERFSKIVEYKTQAAKCVDQLIEQLEYRPHNIPVIDKISIRFILIIGTLELKYFHYENENIN